MGVRQDDRPERDISSVTDEEKQEIMMQAMAVAALEFLGVREHEVVLIESLERPPRIAWLRCLNPRMEQPCGGPAALPGDPWGPFEKPLLLQQPPGRDGDSRRWPHRGALLNHTALHQRTHAALGCWSWLKEVEGAGLRPIGQRDMDLHCERSGHAI